MQWLQLRNALLALAFAIASAPAGSEPPTSAGAGIQIDHAGVSCVVAGQYPYLEARVTPPKETEEARILFRGPGVEDWYWVVMERRGEVYSGVLPQPSVGLERFDYYVEAIGKGLQSSRTEEFTVEVVGNAAACADGAVAGVLGSAMVSVVAPAGAASVPAGFSPHGVVAGAPAGAAASAAGAGATTAGGISSTALIVGGVAAAGGVAALAAGGGSSSSETSTSGSGTPTPAPTPEPTPTPQVYDIRGTWTLEFTYPGNQPTTTIISFSGEPAGGALHNSSGTVVGSYTADGPSVAWRFDTTGSEYVGGFDDADHMSGTMVSGGGQSGTWTAVRS